MSTTLIEFSLRSTKTKIKIFVKFQKNLELNRLTVIKKKSKS
jgi:hypothetical protein